MSLKKFRLWVTLVLGSGLTLLAMALAPKLAELPERRAQRPALEKGVTGAITYRLRDAWTRFPLPRGTTATRCLFNANLPEPVFGASWKYRIGWRWLDGHGDVLAEGTHALRTKLTPYRGDGGDHTTLSFYESEGRVPADLRRLHFSAADLPTTPAYFELRLLSAEQPLDSVNARVAVLIPDQVDDARLAWQRISRRERRQLLAENALHRLEPGEMTYRLKNRPRPVGPVGVLGRDYMADRLYTLLEPGVPIDEQQPPSWEAQGMRLKAWQVTPDQAVMWQWQPLADRVSFRLDLRTRQPAAVTYVAFGQDGRIVADGTLYPSDELAPCDFLQRPGIPEAGTLETGDQAPGGREFGHQVGVPNRYFFRLPPGTERLKLLADVPVMAMAWLRPSDLPLRQSQGADHGDDRPLPAWFSLKPLVGGREETLFTMAGDSAVIPDSQERLLEELLPQGDWLGRHLLLPREMRDRDQLNALATVFSAFPAEPVLTLEISADTRLFPTLVFQRKSTKPMNLKVLANGKTLLRERISARGGELSLGGLGPGNHRLEVVTKETGAQFWINHLPPRNQFWRRKMAVSLDRKPLTFQVTKSRADRFTLTARVVRPAAGDQPLVLQARVLARPSRDEPQQGYTFLTRQWTVFPQAAQEVKVPGLRHSPLAESQPLYIHLEQDLPPGSYGLTIERLAGPPAYVSLSYLRMQGDVTAGQAVQPLEVGGRP